MPAPDDYDTPWKEVLTRYFPELMAFFFPEAHASIDWSRGYDFLDKELRQVTRDAKLGTRPADKLARVWRHGDDEEVWVLVHPEIQGQSQAAFAKRMYVYNYRIFDRFDRMVMSCAILTDDRPDWRPDRFGYRLLGCEVGFRFPVAKVLDYADRWPMLEAETNPFATVVMAHLKARETKRSASERAHWKIDLVRRLYRKGYERQQVIDLFRFIDWLLALPEELEEGFLRQVAAIEEETAMPYVTSVERIGIRKGLAQGLEQGLEKGLEQGLRQGFAQGREQGVELGRREALRAVAVNLMDLLDDEAIAQRTGLPLEEVRQLRAGVPRPPARSGS
ncbi:MAG: cytosolic protein [Thermodesulfobacteriota bacterium]